MDIEIHRARRTYYPHATALVNVPRRDLDALLSIDHWPVLIAARFLNLPEVGSRRLSELARLNPFELEVDEGIRSEDLDAILARQRAGQLSAEQVLAELVSQREQHRLGRANPRPPLEHLITERTGLALAHWVAAAHELLEAVVLTDASPRVRISAAGQAGDVGSSLSSMGFARVALVPDYPMVTATFGFSRAEYAPAECRLNTFPAQRDHGGRIPVFVDQIQADALIIDLDHHRVVQWLRRNGFAPSIPAGTDAPSSMKGYFVRLFEDFVPGGTIRAATPELRMVFGLLHTISHLAVRQAALVCGLDATSLSEYLLPRGLTVAVYSNHRFGASIGALAALYDDSLTGWLKGISERRHCVYDPVCRDGRSACHACAHLAETSCRFFNLNLSRALLFGGHDPELGNLEFGFFDPI